MAVSLPPLLFRVRSSVAEISVANMDDLAMYREIVKASDYINAIKMSTKLDAELETPIVCLAAYYCHVNYTLLNVRQIGTIDEAALIRQKELKRIARAMLMTVTEVDIDNDLAINDARYEKMGGIGFALTNGALNDTRW
jgi:hypothetical protein